MPGLTLGGGGTPYERARKATLSQIFGGMSTVGVGFLGARGEQFRRIIKIRLTNDEGTPLALADSAVADGEEPVA